MAIPKKIIHVVRRFSPANWGGIETSVLKTCNALLNQGIKSEIFCTNTFSEAKVETINSIKVRRFSHFIPTWNLSKKERMELELKGANPFSWSLFAALLREPDVDLIHVHTRNRLGGIARTAARWRKIPYVVTLHSGYELPPEQQNYMLRPAEGKWEWGKALGWLVGSRQLLQDAQGIICVNPLELEPLRNIYGNRVFYVPNSVDVEAFEKTSGKFFLDTYTQFQNKKILLCVSRIDYSKNHVLLVKAFAKLKQRHPDAVLLFIGPISAPDYFKEVLLTAERLGVSAVLHRLEFKPDDLRLISAFKAAHLFVLASSLEPFGIVIIEAWAAGIPVVASKVGGIPGFSTDMHNILLFENNSEEQLLERLTLGWEDENLRAKLQKQGLEDAKKYSIGFVGQQLIDIYKQVSTSQ